MYQQIGDTQILEVISWGMAQKRLKNTALNDLLHKENFFFKSKELIVAKSTARNVFYVSMFDCTGTNRFFVRVLFIFIKIKVNYRKSNRMFCE